MDLNTIFQGISYIVTVIIGGVGYKYYELYLSNKIENKSFKKDFNAQAIENLENQVKAYSGMAARQDERIQDLEDKVYQYQKEILEVTKHQVRAESKVEVLQTKINYLENLLSQYTDAHTTTVDTKLSKQ